jgi:hypothetical protein
MVMMLMIISPFGHLGCGRSLQKVWETSVCSENHIPLRHWGVWTSSLRAGSTL